MNLAFCNLNVCQVIRENVMVALANIAGHTDLTNQPESLVRPILSGLLEWAVSPSAAAQVNITIGFGFVYSRMFLETRTRSQRWVPVPRSPRNASP